MRLFAKVRFRVSSARRGRRYPPGAHAGAVGAARRLHCDARSAVAPQNSLRSLRSLRSDNCGESVHEARCARRLRPCAFGYGSHALRAYDPSPQLRCRRPTNRPHRVPPAASSTTVFLDERNHRVRKGAGGWPAARLLRSREAQGLRPRAQRASSSDSSQLFERSERSSRSEFCDGPQDRASQGTLAQRGQATKRRRPPARAFARAALRTHRRRRESPTGREPKVVFPASRRRQAAMEQLT
jgi:hypothetical protein